MLNGSFDIRTLALLAGVLFYEQYRIEKRLTTLTYNSKYQVCFTWAIKNPENIFVPAAV